MDEDLLAALRRGEADAFDETYDRWRPRIYSFLLRLAGRREVAEELLQETFLQLALHASDLRPDSDLRAWLFTVARNRWRSWQRWSWLDGRRLLDLARSGPPSPRLPDELATARAELARLEAALACLPDRLREVALLVLVEGMEPQEAATVLGIRPDAARQRLARARAALAPALEGNAP